MTTQAEWLSNTAVLVMGLVPGVTYAEAKELADEYLVVAGGWNPDDPSVPTGAGEPANAASSAAAADSIKGTEYDEVRTVTVTVPVSLRLTYTQVFNAGTSDSTILEQTREDMQGVIEDALAAANIRVVSYNWAGSSGTVRSDGALTTQQRVDVQTEITSEPTLIDPAAVATVIARQRYSLDSKWVASHVFVDTGVIYVHVDRYTSTTYATADSPGYRYVVTLGEDLSLHASHKL